MRNVCTLIHYSYVATYIQINDKFPCVPLLFYVRTRTYSFDFNNWIPICKYISHMLIWFNIQRHFRVRLSVSVYNPCEPVNCARKYHMKINRHNLHNYTQTCFTHHNTLLHTCNIHNMKTILWQPVICAGKYCKKQNFHHLYNFRLTRFTHHHTLLHTTTFLYQY